MEEGILGAAELTVDSELRFRLRVMEDAEATGVDGGM